MVNLVQATQADILLHLLDGWWSSLLWSCFSNMYSSDEYFECISLSFCILSEAASLLIFKRADCWGTVTEIKISPVVYSVQRAVKASDRGIYYVTQLSHEKIPNQIHHQSHGLCYPSSIPQVFSYHDMQVRRAFSPRSSFIFQSQTQYIHFQSINLNSITQPKFMIFNPFQFVHVFLRADWRPCEKGVVSID